jgi:putative tricarboxylic transport membrane protein
MKISQDSVLGLFFALTGCIALWIALQYPFGTAGRMGPGYFPVIIAGLLVATGIFVLIRSVAAATDPLPGFRWKPLLMVPAAIFIFGLAIEPLGLLPAVFLLLVVSAMTSVKFRLDWKAFAGALAFSGLCAALFVELIGLPMPVFGAWLQ